MTSTQPSQLLASLFQQIDAEQRVSVFDAGAALPDTVNFFSTYRSKLYFADLFSELPLLADPDEGPSLVQQFADLLRFTPETRFDICLFWDLFNYLSAEAISAFLEVLRPRLHGATLGHGFAVHNVRSPQANCVYGIRQVDQLSVRDRDHPLPGYAPHNQSQLKSLLVCFNFERTVLLSNSRLELLLRARP